MQMQKNILLVVGNGFDLNMGLETSYDHFFKYVDDKSVANDLIYELKERHKKNWVDIEHELADCAINGLSLLNQKNSMILDAKKEHILEHHEYNELKRYLKHYLLDLQGNFENFENKSSYKLLEQICSNQYNNITVLDFNYTNTIDILANSILTNRHLELPTRFKHIHIHGDLDSEIVFGIDDKAEVDENFVYLHKSFDHFNTTSINISALLEDSRDIYFYGYSLGETDKSYFADFFKERCLYNNHPSKHDQKTLTFYHYKETGYIELFNRLLDLTNHSTAKLRQYNNVRFIDSDL